MSKKWIVLIFLAVFAGLYYYVFFTGQDYQPMGDMAASNCLKYALGDETWCSYVQCGVPAVGSLLSAWRYNPICLIYNWIYPHDRSEYRWIAPFFLLAALGVCAVLIRLEVPLAIGLICGLLYAFNPTMLNYAGVGHGSKLMTIALLPWLLFFTDRLIVKRGVLSILLLAGCFWLQLVSLHVQIAYYGVMMVVFYCLWHSIKQKSVWPSVRVGMGLFIGVLLSAPLYTKVWEYSKLSVRSAGVGWDYATQWSFHPLESISYVLPGFFGFGGATYHGYMPFTYAPLYWGIAVLVFAVMAIIWGKSRLKWFLVILAGLAWVMSFGKYLPILYAPAYFILPIFDKFRAPMMIQVLVLLPMVLLSGVGMKTVMKRFKWGWLVVVVAGVVGLAQFAVMGKRVVQPVSAQTMQEYLKPDSVVQFLQQDSTIFRILPLVKHHNPNWYAVHHLESVLGQIGVSMANYQAGMDSLFPSWEFLSLANVKYVITESPQESPYLEQVFLGDGQYVYLYNRHQPRAFFYQGAGEVSWLEKSADRNVLYVFTETESLLFISQTYHPRWKAKMDGFNVPIEQVNGMFTGIIVPAGQHRIELEFNPWRSVDN